MADSDSNSSPYNTEQLDLDDSLISKINSSPYNTEQLDLDDSLISKMCSLGLTSPKESGFNDSPKLSSTLIVTTDHPLMHLDNDNYINNTDNSPINYNKSLKSNNLGNISSIFFDARSNDNSENINNQSCASSYEYNSTKPEYSYNNRVLTFDLPMELSSNISTIRSATQMPDSPEHLSSSSQDHSSYRAMLDPYSGNVAMKHSPAQNLSGSFRRKIRAKNFQSDDDASSLDSLGEEEPAPKELQKEDHELPKQTIVIHDSNCESESSDPIPEYSAAEEMNNERATLNVPLSNGEFAVCDMKVIEPFKRVLSHGGYDKGTAIIVLSGCHLPDRGRPDYTYVMDNLFLYVMWTVDRLVTDEYILVYLHGKAGGRSQPSIGYLQQCHRLIDRRLRKSLKSLYVVYPSYFLRTIIALAGLFISSKTFRKIHYVHSLKELQKLCPVEPNAVPQLVQDYDARRQ